LVISLQQTKQYSATATLLFQNQNYAQGLFGTSANFTPNVSVNDPTRQAATDLSLVQQSVIATKTAETLGQGLTTSRVQSYISAGAVGQSDLVSVTAATPHRQLSAAVANAYAIAFVAYRRELQRGAVAVAARQVTAKLHAMTAAGRNSPAGRELAARQQDLAIFASLQTGDAQLYTPATTPTSASSPRPVRNTVIGLFVGILLGLCLALVAERLDRRVRDAEEFEEIFQRPMLGKIEKSRRIADQRQAHRLLPGGAETESFRTLRANLRYLNVDRTVRSVVITSAMPGEGKSVLSWNLAEVSAMAGQRVLLVEADLRRPVFGEFLGNAPGKSGLSDVLAGHSSLDQVVQHVSVPSGSAANGADEDRGPELAVVTSGPVPPNPGDLLESGRMASFLHEVIGQYEFVVIDTPPTSVVSDALHLFPYVDGVIAVTRLGTTPRDRAKALVAQLRRVEARLLGIVVNGAPALKKYGQYGGYGYRNPTQEYLARSGADDTVVTTDEGVVTEETSNGRSRVVTDETAEAGSASRDAV
jgi:capsular exopolysaccharide synthesis family protein